MLQFDKIKVWFDQLGSLTKMALTVGSAVGIITGYLTIHDNKVISRYDKANEQKEIKVDLKKIMDAQARDTIARIINNKRVGQQIDSLIAVINGLTESVTTLKSTNNNLENWLINNASTKDDVLNIIDIFKKKSFEFYDSLYKKNDVKIKIEQYDKNKKRSYTIPASH